MLLLLTATMSVARPNVLLLFADDWGWGDLGANYDPNPHLSPFTLTLTLTLTSHLSPSPSPAPST